MKRFSVALILLAAFVSIRATAFPQSDSVARQMADSTIKRWPDGQIVANGKTLSDWAYDKNTLFAGFAEMWQNTADPDYFRYIQRSMDRLVTAEGAIPSHKPEDLSLDEVALGRQLLLMYGRTRKEKWYKAAAVIRHQLDAQPRTPSGGFWHKKRYPNQMWLDGLYMAEPFYAQYASMFQEPKDFDDIAHQFVLIEQHTRDPKTGLLYHGWDESKQMGWANKQTGAAPDFWARADGWYAMALVDSLPWFPKDHPGRAQLIAILERLAPAIAATQDPETGLWYEVMDKPKAPGNYLESSASCMFVYALAKGARLGYLDPKYLKIAERGYDGILKTFVKKDVDGSVTLDATVYGAGLGDKLTPENSYEYYTHVPVGPSDPKGIGAFLMAAAEMEVAPTATFGRGKNVVLDAWFNSQKRQNAAEQTEYFHYKWTDFDNSGFSTFGHIFRNYGAQTDTLYSAPTVANLKSAQVYIIVSPDIPDRNPKPNYMTEADAAQIAQWVKNGGVLVMMENDSGNSEFAHFNKLSEKFGVHFNAVLRNRVDDSKWEMGKVSVPAGTGIFPGPHTFYMKEISTITPSKPAQAIVTDSGDVVMAIAKYGKGTVFAMTDPWLYNEYTDGLKLPPEFQNYQGGKELAHWLLQQAGSRPAQMTKGLK
ncbi:MAG: glycoside hydrolase family 88 protein [Terriglobales bacterium]